MKKILKKYYVLIIGIFIGSIISASMVYAWYDDDSSEVSYDNSNDWLVSTNVHDALIELHNQKGCPVGSICLQKKNTLSLGDYVNYTPGNCSYTTDTSMTGYTSTQTISPCELTLWRVLSVNGDGTIDIISEYVSSTDVYFKGLTGYKNYVGYLNVLANQYETSGITIGSRHFGYSNQTEYITSDAYFVNPAPWTCKTGGTCTPDPDDYEAYGGGDKLYLNDYNLVNTVLGKRVANKVGTLAATYYWMSSRYYNYSSATYHNWSASTVSTGGGISYYNMYSCYNGNFSDGSDRRAIRPIVTLASGLTYSGVGTKEYPMEIDVEMATATFYYNSNSTNGETTIASTTIGCAINPSTGNCTVTIPSEVTSSVGTYNNAYAGLSSSTGNMTAAVANNATTITLSGDATYYSLYRSAITNYYFRESGGGGYATRTLSRNQWFTSPTAMATTIISTSNTGTSNYTTEAGPGSSVWSGLSTEQDTTTEYSTVASAAASTATSLYTVYTFNVTYAKGSNVSSIGATTGACNVTYTAQNCNVTLPSITPASGYTALGWSTTQNATSGNTAAGSTLLISTNATTLYANTKAYFNPAVGTYVTYTPSKSSYTTDTSKTGASSTVTIKPNELTKWQVLKVNSDGTVDIISRYISSKGINFTGVTGYVNYIGYLNTIASQYENSTYTVGSRYFGYSNQTQIITDTSKITSSSRPWSCSTGTSGCSTVESQGGGDTGYTTDYNIVKNTSGLSLDVTPVGDTQNTAYWLASRSYVTNTSSTWNFSGRTYIVSSGLANYAITSGPALSNYGYSWRLRPIVTLKATLTWSGSGTAGSPYTISN